MAAAGDRVHPDSLIFDMDGTLWDAVETYAQGFNDFFKANRMERSYTRSDLARYMGWEQAKYLEATMPDFPPAQRELIYKEVIEFQYRRIQQDGGALYEGVQEGLARLAEKYKLFIVSNCPEFTIDHFTRWAGVTSWITDTVAHGSNFKPKLENIRYLIRKHHLQHPIYIGDTDSDSQQSRLVPLPFIFMDYGFGTTDQYQLRFSSFQQLVDHLLG